MDAGASLKEDETQNSDCKKASDAFSATFDAHAKTDRYCRCCYFLEAWVSVEVWKTTVGPEAILLFSVCFGPVLVCRGLFTEGVVQVSAALTHQRAAAPQFLRPVNDSQTVKELRQRG